jgi:threonine synthase
MQSTNYSTLCCIETTCGASYEINERIYACPRCGGLLEAARDAKTIGPVGKLKEMWTNRLTSFDAKDRSGVWRYRELLPFDESVEVVSLFEGNTPIYEATRSAKFAGLDALKLKHQGCNPTASFKDNGMTVAVTQARNLGAQFLVCASTGNTAASLAAYAARAEMASAILVPQGQISMGKLAQSLDYGARVFELEGNFDDAMRVTRELGFDESVYLVNSINPFRIEGQKTVAAELVHQLAWSVPDHVVMPGGNLGNSAAFGKGFRELCKLGVIARAPKLSVIQAEGAAPLAHLYEEFGVRSSEFGVEEMLAVGLKPVDHPQTLATAIKIGSPVSWKKSLRAVVESGGRVITVSEQEIADAKAIIGRDGVGCEPASATTVAGIKKLVQAGFIRRDENVVAILTGHVLKDSDYVINYHLGKLFADENTAEGETIKQRIASTRANTPVCVKATKEAILEELRK